VIGSGDDGSPEEFENFKAISVMAAALPGVTIRPWKVEKFKAISVMAAALPGVTIRPWKV
ncbi:hypothetical protein T484DRAFT_1859973, partial [Baffinella frigidus]